MKRDLGKLIQKYEKRPYRWGSPRKAASMDHLLPLDCRYYSSWFWFEAHFSSSGGNPATFTPSISAEIA